MIDSVLKGTGNSRFLKSAVPAGTSWADALAMLQAGTFPIDFNGINTEGFQQVGTPLNKANLLKDATAAQIGLPPSTTPDGMFQALGNTGELHVWRKTVTTTQEIPAGYVLGDIQTNVEVFSGGGSNQSVLYYDDSPNVDDAGNVTIPNEGGNNQYAFYANSNFNVASYMRGKYIQIYPGGGYTAIDGVWFVPSDATITVSGYKINVSKIQKVTGYAKVPAGTTTTYPVSTNPNAHQEVDDAKEAGYTLGEVVSGNFQVGYLSNVSEVDWNYSDTLNVADNGTLTLKNPTPAKINTATSSGYQNPSVLLGHFAVVTGHKENIPGSPFADEQIVYIPSNAVVSGMYIDRYQPVTGYAAIPAGTTIEYLGRLGDKARVQVVSYVGTGTYGKDNPCSITADFKIKLAMMLGYFSTGYGLINMLAGSLAANILIASVIGTEYKQHYGFTTDRYNYPAYGKISKDQKTFSWYGTDSRGDYYNSSGYPYYILVIG